MVLVSNRNGYHLAPASSLMRRIVLIGISVGILASCATISSMLPAQRAADRRARAAQALQLEVMRFADGYSGEVDEVTTRYQAGTTTPENRRRAQEWKLEQSQSAYTIASGPSALANAVDMVVLATLSRMVIEDVWHEDTDPAQVAPIANAHRTLEEESWRLLQGRITDSQIAELRDVMGRWRRQNPQVRSVAFIHILDLATSAGVSVTDKAKTPESLFSLLEIDPLRDLDPAVRELAQSRALAERSIYYAQRAPGLLRMQAQELLYQASAMPEARSLLDDLNRASLVGSAADNLTKSLPEMLSQQREALISQLMRELSNRTGSVTAVSADIRSTLQAATVSADAAHATVEEIDRVTARMSQGKTESRPFDIRDYTTMLQQADAAARDLSTLTRQLGTSLPAVRATTQQLLDRLFVLLIMFVFVCFLLGLAYRALVLRMGRR